MSKKIIVITIALAAAALVVFFTIRYTFRESEKSVETEPAIASLSASQLLKIFETNEDSANQLYMGKVISVEGMVHSVDEDSTSVSVYLKNPDDLSGVICIFDKNIIDQTSIQTGKKTAIKGFCSGYLFDVILNRCVITD